MRRSLLFALCLLFYLSGNVCANLTTDEIRELNDATPGTFKVQLGTVLSAEQATIDSNTTSIGTNSSNISTNVTDIATNVTNITTAQNTADTAFNRIDNVALKFLTTGDTSITNTSALAYVRKYTGTQDEGINLAAGDTLQIITFALAWEGGGNFAITPDTASGFFQVNLSKTGDNATLRYVDASIGWTLMGLATSDTGGGVVRNSEPYN